MTSRDWSFKEQDSGSSKKNGLMEREIGSSEASLEAAEEVQEKTEEGLNFVSEGR